MSVSRHRQRVRHQHEHAEIVAEERRGEERRGLILISGVSELRQSVIVRFVVAAGGGDGGGGGSQPRSPSWPSRRDREQFCCHA